MVLKIIYIEPFMDIISTWQTKHFSEFHRLTLYWGWTVTDMRSSRHALVTIQTEFKYARNTAEKNWQIADGIHTMLYKEGQRVARFCVGIPNQNNMFHYEILS